MQWWAWKLKADTAGDQVGFVELVTPLSDCRVDGPGVKRHGELALEIGEHVRIVASHWPSPSWLAELRRCLDEGRP